MPDKTFDILIDIRARLDALQNAQRQMQGITAEARNFNSVMSGFAGGIAGGAFAQLTGYLARIPGMFAEAVSSGVRFNATLESSQLGIAAIIKQFDQSGKIKTFDDALQRSTGTLEILKAKAKETSATFEELVQGFQANAGPLFQSGIANAKQQVDIVVAASQGMAALAIPTNQLNQELRALFQGDVSKNSRLNQVLQITKEEIDRAVTSGTAYELLMKRLASFAEAGARSQETLNTRLSNFGDITTELKAIGTSELFEMIRVQLGEMNVALSDPQTAEKAAGWGAVLKEQLEGVMGGIRNTRREWQYLVETFQFANSLTIGDVLTGRQPDPTRSSGGGPSTYDVAAAQRFASEAERARNALIDQVREAASLDQNIRAILAIEQRRLELVSRLGDKNALIREEAQRQLGQLDALKASYETLAGSADKIHSAWKMTNEEIEASLKKMAVEQEHFRTLAELQAKINGDERAELETRLLGLRSKLLEKYNDGTRSQIEAVRMAEEELRLTRQLGEQEIRNKETKEGSAKADEAAAEAKRKQAEILREIGAQQNAVAGDPFALIAEKNAALIPLLQQEAEQLRLTGHEWEALARAREAAALTPTGEFQASMISWVNSFGTAANQAAGVIQGTLNTAIQQTSKLLTDAIFRTGDWRQALIAVGQAGVQSLIEMGLQMVIQNTIGRALKQQTTAESVTQNATVLASAAPAATAEGAASWGANWIVGAIAAAAAVAAIAAALSGGFARGGRTGNGPKIATVGEEGEEFVFTAGATRNIGIENLYAMMHAAERAPHFAVGGRRDDEWLDPGNVTLPGSPGGMWPTSGGGAQWYGAGARFSAGASGSAGYRGGPQVSVVHPASTGGLQIVPGGSNAAGNVGGSAIRDFGGYGPGYASTFGAGAWWSPRSPWTGYGTSNSAGRRSTSIATYWGPGRGTPAHSIPTAGAGGNYFGAAGGAFGSNSSGIYGSGSASGFMSSAMSSAYSNLYDSKPQQTFAAGGRRMPGAPVHYDNQLAWLGSGEHVLTTAETQAFDRTFGRAFLDNAFENVSVLANLRHFDTGGRAGGGSAMESLGTGGGRGPVEIHMYANMEEAIDGYHRSGAADKHLMSWADRSRIALGMPS